MKRWIPALLLFWSLAAPGAPPPKLRLASLSPELTEIVFLLEGEAQLVGRSSACDYPARARSIPVVGNMASPALEALALARPDRLVAESLYESGARERVEKLGITVEYLPSKDLTGYRRAVARLGELLGREAAAAAEIARVDAVIASYRARYGARPAAKRPSVLLVVWDSPLIVAGGKNFLSGMIELAGGRNAAAESPKNYFRCSAEWALQAAPDLIIFPRGMGEAEAAASAVPAVLKGQPAVAAGRFYPEPDADLFFRMGPRFTKGLARLETRIRATAEQLYHASSGIASSPR